MTQLLWDASALAKRYVPEVGSQAVDALWEAAPYLSMIGTFPTYAEVHWILLRKRSRGDITTASFTAAKSSLHLEVADSLDFRLLEVETADTLAGIVLTEKYSIGPSDAMILAAYMRYARSTSDTCVLIASDLRLLRAADAEGLRTLNPEITPASEMFAFLSAL